ncbi:MAG: MFS transporter [Crenarchaeota archaeon]|nr:MFS transporter [Thermoproteota archaeon]
MLDTAFLIGVIAPYAVSLGADERLAGLIAGLYGMASLPASVAAAFIVDRLGRLRSLALGLWVDSLSVLAYGFADSVSELAVYRVVHGVGGSLVYPAYLASVGDQAAPGRLGGSLGAYLAPVGAVIGVGALAGAALLRLLGFQGLFTALSAAIAAGAAAATLLAAGSPAAARGRRVGAREVLEGIRAGGRALAAALASITLLYLGFGLLVGGLGPALLAAGHAASEEEAAAAANTLIGLSSLAAAAALPPLGRLLDSRGAPTAVLAPGLAGSAALAASALEPTLFPGYGLAVASGLLGSSYLVLRTPAPAAAAAAQQVFNILGVAIGAPLGGLAASVSPPTLLLAAAAASAAAAATASWGHTALHKQPLPAEN